MTDARALTAKTAEAAHQYALKNYVQAADLYSQASELQRELNGEMAPANAELLYAYGRCLYKVAVENSDVLGGRVAGPGGGGNERGKKRKVRDGDKEAQGGDDDGTTKAAANGAGKAAGATSASAPATAAAAAAAEKKDTKPYFQIEGDDADWDSDEAEAEGEDDGGDADGNDDDAAQEDEDEDDLAVAYEVLDIARILLERRVKISEESETSGFDVAEPDTASAQPQTRHKGKAKASTATATVSTPQLTHLRTLLSDTYDLQSEINLENEQFPLAASDAKSSLALKSQLYTADDPVLAEAHYKVSLALEFAAKTTREKPDELTGETKTEVEGVDEAMLRESAMYMEKAIESTKARVVKEEKELTALTSGAEKAAKQRNIDDVKEILTDMADRLRDLRTPVTAALSTAALTDPSNPGRVDEGGIAGILGGLLGEAPAVAKQRIADATKNATDLTGMVRRGGRKGAANGAANGAAKAANGSNSGTTATAAPLGKRKAGDGDAITRTGNGTGKKARVEDAEDELS